MERWEEAVSFHSNLGFLDEQGEFLVEKNHDKITQKAGYQISSHEQGGDQERLAGPEMIFRIEFHESVPENYRMMLVQTIGAILDQMSWVTSGDEKWDPFQAVKPPGKPMKPFETVDTEA